MTDTLIANGRRFLDPQPRDLFEQELLARTTVPTLSDGTPLSDLVDLRKREVQLRAMNDPELHRLEMERIWARNWIPVCHETDLPNVGDFKRGYIGEDKVIVTRARDRSINVFLNVCSHRGMEVCWSDEGNAAHFKCPYHGWVFDLKGKLMGAPFEREEYGDWNKSDFPLRAARVESRHGVYFANLDENAPSLESSLTEFVGFFDMMFGTHELVSVDGNELGITMGDLIPSGVIASNWKPVAVQNVGDGYHTVTLHQSLAELGMLRGGDAKGWSLEDSHDISSRAGHGVRVVEVDSRAFGLGGENAFPLGHHVVGSMFPSCNISLSARMVRTKTGKEILVWMASIGARAPRGRRQSVESGFLVTLINKEAHEAIVAGDLMHKGKAGRPFDFSVASAADDPESWISQTRSAEGPISRQQTIKYNALKGAAVTPEIPDGLGLVAPGFAKDDSAWWWWLAYYDWMTRP